MELERIKPILLKILKGRMNAKNNDTQEYQQKATTFLDKLSCITPYCQDLQTFEMYKTSDEPIKSKPRIYCYLNKFHNTRLKLSHETRAEIDKLEFDASIRACCYIITQLIEHGYSFYVFYAQGQRSVHIIIYDFYELEGLTAFRREKAQEQFWRNIAGLYSCVLDKSIWGDNHPVPLEFRPHWKYGTVFDLLLEYVAPEQEEIHPFTKPKYKFQKTTVKKQFIQSACSIHGDKSMYLAVGGWTCNFCQLDKFMEKTQCSA